MLSGPSLPFEDLEMIFLDAGNTLVSMDYVWIRDELSGRGHAFSLQEVRRAEAAARPTVSRFLRDDTSTEADDTFTLYLRTLIAGLLPSESQEPARLATELVPVLRGPGRERLWSYVLPGVPEALAELASLGARLAVVSNSDGTVENVLRGCGLRGHVEAVFDSQRVGYEKPDPRLFLHALESTGARPARTLHVGDLYSVDVEGARAAGLHAALLDPYGDWQDADCARFEDLTEVSARFRESRKR